MALFQLGAPFIQCMHMNKRPVPSVPQGAVSTWATNQMAAMECAVILVCVGRLFVETAVFTKAVWTTMNAVRNTDTGVLLVSLQSILSMRAIPAEYQSVPTLKFEFNC